LLIVGEIYLTRRAVRRQELEADEQAVRFGARPEDLEAGLRKLTAMNDLPTDKKDPSTWFCAAAAHPTTDERIAILRDRIARGFPRRPGLLAELSAPARAHARPLAAIAIALAVLGTFGYQRNRPAQELRQAAAKGDLGEVRRLIAAGTDPDAVDRLHQQDTALMAAAQAGQSEVAMYLIQAGVDVNRQNLHHSTALTAAAEFGHEAIVRMLIDRGADVNHRDGDGDTSLGMAIHRKHAEVAKLLLKAGAKDTGRLRSIASSERR
jgi:hypothetical protein